MKLLLMNQGLFDEKLSTEFYDERYKHGYMGDWPEEKKKRVLDIIKGLNLPETGDALDFGCGNGIFTRVIKQALPKWNVYGVDISSVAVENARRYFPDCRFFTQRDLTSQDQKFDFLFSHHVLEHVSDLREATDSLANLAGKQASMLHILPCGNPGSMEYKLSKMRKDGINPAVGNRFFFEDEGHLRRLTTGELSTSFAPYGFKLHDAFYANQYYGAIDWITGYDNTFISNLASPAAARTWNGSLTLLWFRTKLLFIKKAQQQVRFPPRGKLIRRWAVRTTLRNVLSFFKYKTAVKITDYYRLQAGKEWGKQSKKPTGSEMYLIFKR